MGIEHKNARRQESQTAGLGDYIWLKMSPKKEENKILIGNIKNPVDVIWKAAVFYGVRFTSLKITHFISFIFLRTQYQFNWLRILAIIGWITKFSFVIIK